MRRALGLTMKVQFVSAIVLLQLMLFIVLLAAIFLGVEKSTAVIAVVCICYLVGLALLVAYNFYWKEDVKSNPQQTTVREDSSQRATQEAKAEIPTDELLSAKRKIAQLLRELEDARSDINELRRFRSDFLAHISHEIRTPLNAVVGMAELLSRTPLTQEQAELVGLVTSSGETLLSVINDILNYSRMDSGEFSLNCIEFEPHDLVEGTTALLVDQARLKDLTLTTFVSTTLARSYLGDADRLKQILLNLLGTAVRFAQRGEVLVSAIEDPEDPNCLKFTVKDSTSSMSNSIVATLFTPLTEVDIITARKYGGTGLGLSVSKQLVELMKGTIGVESTESDGTTYWFSAKLRPAPATEDATEPEPIPATKVLLTGHATSSMAVIMAYCKSWGLSCDYQPTSIEAIQALSASPNEYQAVIVEPQAELAQSLEFIKQLFAAEQLGGIHAIVLTENESTELAVRHLGLTLQTLRKPLKKLCSQKPFGNAISICAALVK